MVDHSPDFIQQKKAVEREILKDQLLNQIEEKRAERQKQKERDVQTGVSIPIENNYKNPYLDYSKPLAQILKEQIESKLQEKERQARVNERRLLRFDYKIKCFRKRKNLLDKATLLLRGCNKMYTIKL